MNERAEKKILISPSILSADFARIGSEVERLEKAGADWVHCDVMDGRFVPNITFGAKFINDLEKYTSLPLDVHLMIAEPERYISDFIRAGADSITFHLEAVCDPDAVMSVIKKNGVRCGIAVSPDTPIGSIEKYIAMSDIILLMGVYPGFGGQKFIEKTYARLEEASALIAKHNPSARLGVDGGINFDNVERIKKSGANVIVAGNAVFTAPDMEKAIGFLRGV